MSAARWTAPTTCAILIAMLLSAIFGERHRQIPRTTPLKPMSSLHLDQHPAGQPIVTELPVIPAGSLLIVGSLDRSARSHTITIELRCDAHPTAVHSSPDGFAPPTVDVRRISEAELHLSHCAGIRVGRNCASGDQVASVADVDVAESCENVVRRFAVPVLTAGHGSHRIAEGRLVAQGQRLQVFSAVTAEAPTSRLRMTQLAAAIVHECETRLLPFLESNYAQLRDIDGDGMLCVVLCDLQPAGLSDRGNNSEPVLGCVRRSDFFLPNADFGGDIVYLDESLRDGDDLSEILTHELAHVVTFSQLAERGSVGLTETSLGVPDWLNEAISHHFERRTGSDGRNLVSRAAAFAKTPHRFPIVIPNAPKFSAYGRGGCRAAGVSFLESVLSSVPGEARVATLLDAQGDAIESLESLADRQFPDLFRNWTIGLLAGRICSDTVLCAKPAISPAPENAWLRNSSRDEAECCIQLQEIHPNRPVSIEIAGTAAAFFEPTTQQGSLIVTGPAESQLQISIVAASRTTTCSATNETLDSN